MKTHSQNNFVIHWPKNQRKCRLSMPQLTVGWNFEKHCDSVGDSKRHCIWDATFKSLVANEVKQNDCGENELFILFWLAFKLKVRWQKIARGSKRWNSIWRSKIHGTLWKHWRSPLCSVVYFSRKYSARRREYFTSALCTNHYIVIPLYPHRVLCLIWQSMFASTSKASSVKQQLICCVFFFCVSTEFSPASTKL